MGRQMGKELNAPYYESSVFTSYGVKEIFENVIRMALIARRHQRFWMTNLKHVRTCLLQEPFCPPRPTMPGVTLPVSTFQEQIKKLYNSSMFADVVFDHTLFGHRIILVASSEMFHSLFTSCNDTPTKSNCCASPLTRWSSDLSVASQDFENSHQRFVDDSLLDVRIGRHFRHFLNASFLYPLLNLDTSKRFSKHSNSRKMLLSRDRLTQPKRKLKQFQQRLITAYKNVKNLRNDDKGCLKPPCQSHITFDQNIPQESLRSYLQLIYSLSPKDVDHVDLDKVQKCLLYLDFVDYDPRDDMKKYFKDHKTGLFIRRIVYWGLEKGLFADVIFKLEDGTCYGHRALLMARCEMMEAMFKGNFRESEAQIVSIQKLPNINKHFLTSICVLIPDCRFHFRE